MPRIWRACILLICPAFCPAQMTLEPKIFGTGGNFVTDVKLDISLHLIHFEKVNEQGTLITKYAVLKK